MLACDMVKAFCGDSLLHVSCRILLLVGYSEQITQFAIGAQKISTYVNRRFRRHAVLISERPKWL